MIAEQYCRHQLFDPYLISASDGTQTWVGHPRDFKWGSLNGQIVTAHNAYFEQCVVKEMERRGWIPAGTHASVKEWVCTANMTAYLCNRRALDQAIEYLFGIPISKVARANADNKHWPQDFSADEQKEMIEYARKDPHYSWLLFEKFKDQWPEKESRLSRLSIEAGLRGVQIDRELLETFIIHSHEMKLNTEKLLPWIVGAEDDEDESWDEFKESNDIKVSKPTSTKCIAEQCRRTGIPCPPVKSDDPEAYEDWEITYSDKYKWITALGAWRSVNRIYKTFLVIKDRLRSDGTMPFELKYFAAHTGRWGGGSKFNMQNMPKRALFCNEHNLLELNEDRIKKAMDQKANDGVFSEWVKYTIDTRNLFIARPGMKLITSDLSQIEPRVLAWLAKDQKCLDSMAAGESPYVAHARATMGFTGVDLKKEDPDKYALAKARILALGYQAGWKKFILMAKVLTGLDVTKDDPETIEEVNKLTGEVKIVSGYGANAKRIVSEYREQNSKVKNLWGTLDDLFKRSIGSDFLMTLPSKRKLRYEKVRCECRIEPDPETKKPVRKSVFTAKVGEKRVITYGGKLTENITQAIARDIFAEKILALEDASHRVLFSVHDEAILEVPEEIPKEAIDAVMSSPVEWLPGCTIAADTKTVACYCK
jgi:hypothetical protein